MKRFRRIPIGLSVTVSVTVIKRAEDRYSFCYSVTVSLLQMALIGLRTVTVSVTVSPSFPCLIGLRTVQVLLQCCSFSFIHDLKRAEDHYSFCYSFSLFPLFNWAEDRYGFCYSFSLFPLFNWAEDCTGSVTVLQFLFHT